MKKFLGYFSLLLAIGFIALTGCSNSPGTTGGSAGLSPEAAVTVQNGVTWTVSGSNDVPSGVTANSFQCHGMGLIKVGSTYYAFGENRLTTDNFYAVSCYKSTDLKTWTFDRNVLTQSSASELSTCDIERPKVVYNASTGMYVMWMHYEKGGGDYSAAAAAVAYCSTVDGNYTYQGHFQPNGQMSRDCTLFVDDDGTAYFISAANNNADMHVYKLSSDYRSVASQVISLFNGSSREAPAMFKRNGRYYLLTSQCTGWSPNQQGYAYSTSISSGWSGLNNIGDGTCYGSQTTYVLPISGTSGTSYLYCGDKWAGASGGKVWQSTYLWLPIIFNSDTSLSMNNYSSITIDVAAGTINGGTSGGTPTPTPGSNLALGKTASADSSQSGNAASAGNDGSTTTRWCANDGNLNHWWKVDLGSSYSLKSTEVDWEMTKVYKYKIEVSSDNSTWTMAVNQTNNTASVSISKDTFAATGRYVRITVTGLPSGTWASFFEFKVQ
jgi:hypothetical protein